MWNETFTFTAQFPELCLLRFAVYDSDTFSDDFIGQYTLPLESVEKGEQYCVCVRVHARVCACMCVRECAYMSVLLWLVAGYRHVHLHTPSWEKIENATIFVHVTIHEAHHFSIKVCKMNNAVVSVHTYVYVCLYTCICNMCFKLSHLLLRN